MADPSTPADDLRVEAFAALDAASRYATTSPTHLAHLTRAGVLASLAETAPSRTTDDVTFVDGLSRIPVERAPTPRTRTPRKPFKPATTPEETPTA